MLKRTHAGVLALCVAIIALGVVAFMPQVRAQMPEGGESMPMMPPPDMGGGMGTEMGMGMGMGMEMGMGMGAGADEPAGPQWQADWADVEEDEGAVTYIEFLTMEGLPNDIDVPELYFTEPDAPGTVKKRTPTQWYQIRQLYRDPEDRRFYPGNKVYHDAQREILVKRNEAAAMAELYRDAVRNAFRFEIGRPEWSVPDPLGDPHHAEITLNVLMKPNRKWSRKMVGALQKFDHWDPRPGRKETFSFITFDGSFYRPYHFQLAPEAIATWTSLWGTNEVRLSIYRHDGSLLLQGRQSVGHGRSTFVDMVHPGEHFHGRVRWNGTDGTTWEGDRWGAEKKQVPCTTSTVLGEGELLAFSFSNVSLYDVGEMDYAHAQLIGDGGAVSSKPWKGPFYSRAGKGSIARPGARTYSKRAPCW